MREEVFTGLIAKTLGNERFLERFELTPGRMTAFKRSIKAVTRMAKCFFGKDRYLYSRCEKMARSIIRVMGEQTALEAVGDRDFSKYIRYSIMNDAFFEENIESIMKMEDSEALRNKEEGNFIKISNNTPRLILEKVKSAKDLQLIIRFDALYLALRKSGVLEGHYHNLGPEILNNLVDYLEKPDAIVVRKDGRLTVVSSFSNNKGKNGVISVELDTVKDINSKYDSYNLVVTIFTSKDNYLKNNLLKNGESVAYEKEDLSQVNPQLHEWLAIVNDKSSNHSIPQNSEKSTGNAKKSFSFDPDTFIQQAMENGGMVEKPKSQADTKKATEEKLKAKVEDLKKENERLEREAKASERKAKPAEDPTVFSGFVMLLDVNAKKLLCKDSYYEGNYGNADTDSCHFKETRRKLHILCHRGVIGEARDNKNDNSYHNCQSNKGIGDKYVGKNERNYCEKIRNSCV